MGGTSKENSSTVKTNTPTIGGGLLDNLLGRLGRVDPSLTGAETTALNSLSDMGLAGNPFASQAGGVASTLLAGGGPDRTGLGNDAYNRYAGMLTPTAQGDYLDPSKNPFYAATTDRLAGDAVERVKQLYAGSGRDPAGAGSLPGEVGKAVTTAIAPTLAGLFSTERGRQMEAMDRLYGAGGQTAGLLSSLDQARLTNQQAGLNAANAAYAMRGSGPQMALAAEQQRRNTLLQALATEIGLVSPIAQAFATNTGTTTATKETPFNPMSLASLALAPISPTSLAGMGLNALGGGLFGSLPVGGTGPRIGPFPY